KRTDTYVIPRVAAHQQRAGRIRDGNAVEWILRTGRPVESPSFLYDRRSHCGCRKLVDSLARSGILGNPGSPFRGWNVHGGRVPRGHENGSELGRERYGITCGLACGRVDVGLGIAALSECNWRLELASDCRAGFRVRRSWCDAHLFCENWAEIRQSSRIPA